MLNQAYEMCMLVSAMFALNQKNKFHLSFMLVF